MDSTLSKKDRKDLINELEERIREKREKGKKLTTRDKLDKIFLYLEPGCVKNGLDVRDIAIRFKQNPKDTLVRYKFASLIGKYSSEKILDDYSFGGIKEEIYDEDGERIPTLKKYNFTDGEEEQGKLLNDRKRYIIVSVQVGKKYLPQDNPIVPFGNVLIKECIRQLELFPNYNN